LPPKRLGMTIKRLREQKGLTQEALADKAGIHRVYLAQIEAATKTPSIATLEKIAKALKVKTAELLA
jgi:transcriptional regulator with XRE-family HTH domain